MAANVEVPLIAFLGPGGSGIGIGIGAGIGAGIGSGLGAGLGVGSGVGLQVLLAVRVFYRALTAPIDHSHPVYTAKCQKLAQLLSADPQRACLEVAQGWMATSTQVLGHRGGCLHIYTPTPQHTYASTDQQHPLSTPLSSHLLMPL